MGSVQVILTLGVVLAQIINIATGKYYPWGCRVSLGLAGLPAIVLTIGGIVLPDTPNSLVERGFEAEGRKVRASTAAVLAQTGSSLELWRIFARLPAMGCKHWLQHMACTAVTCQARWRMSSRASERAARLTARWEAALQHCWCPGISTSPEPGGCGVLLRSGQA